MNSRRAGMQYNENTSHFEPCFSVIAFCMIRQPPFSNPAGTIFTLQEQEVCYSLE